QKHAGAEEQRDLREGVDDDVHPAREDRQVIRQRGGQHDVGELADRRIREPQLQVVLAQREDRGDQQRRRRRVLDGLRRSVRAQRDETENVYGDLEDRKHAELDHGDGVQQRRNRRRRDHRRRQPAMERHQRRLAGAESEQRENQRQQPGRDARDELVSLPEHPALDKRQRPGQDIGPAHRRQQKHDGRAEQYRQVRSSGGAVPLLPAVRDERVSGERQRLVEEIQRQQIA